MKIEKTKWSVTGLGIFTAVLLFIIYCLSQYYTNCNNNVLGLYQNINDIHAQRQELMAQRNFYQILSTKFNLWNDTKTATEYDIKTGDSWDETAKLNRQESALLINIKTKKNSCDGLVLWHDRISLIVIAMYALTLYVFHLAWKKHKG